MKKTLLFFLLCLGSAGTLLGWGYWEAYKSDRFTVFYGPGYEKQALRLLNTMEYYAPTCENLIGNKVENLSVVLEDLGQVSNGYAEPVANTLHINSYFDGLLPAENWERLVGTHEYTHILQTTKTSYLPEILSKGISTIFYPNMLLPLWIIEGTAVYTESQFSPYSGRLNDGFFDAYIAARVTEGKGPSIMDATYAPKAYPEGAGVYIYGAAFLRYLSQKYGEDKLKLFFDAYGGSMGSYFSPLFPFMGMDENAKLFFGSPFEKLWQDWLLYETKENAGYKMDGEQITKTGWKKKSPVFYEGKLYYISADSIKTGALRSFSFSQIMALDPKTNTEKIIKNLNSESVLPIKIYNAKLYYAVYEIKIGFINTSSGFGKVQVIHEFDLKTGEDKKIYTGKVRAFCPLKEGAILIALDGDMGNNSVLIKINTQNSVETTLPLEYIVDDIEVSGDYVVVSARHDWENHGIYNLNIKTGALVPMVNTPFEECRPLVINSGEKIIFSANYGKTYGIYCYDAKEGKVEKMTVGGYAVAPAYDTETKELYFCGLTSQGNEIYKKKADFEKFSLPLDKPSEKPLYPEYVFKKGSYLDELATLLPQHKYPIVLFDDKGMPIAAGVGITGTDATMENNYSAALSYDGKRKIARYELSLFTQFFQPAQLSFSYNNYYARGGKHLITSVGLPVFKTLEQGLTDINIGYTVDLYENFKKSLTSPYISAGFNWPGVRAGLGVSMPIVSKKIGYFDSLGVYGEAQLNLYTSGSELDFKAQGLYDPDSIDEILPVARGYAQALLAKAGGVFSADFTCPLIQIRSGVWNPNIYLEDICGRVFVETVVGNMPGQIQLSVGTEFTVEIKMFFGLAIEMGGQLTYNKNNQFGVGPVLKAAGLF
ncbi:MAG: hypothetical protein WCJ46_04530 [bacterium]